MQLKERLNLLARQQSFFEIHFVLKSFYGKDKSKLSEILSKVLNLSIFFPERQLLQDNLILYERSIIGLEDCYNIMFAKIQGAKDFKTFDVRLNKVAKAFLEEETLELEEFEKLVGKKKS